MGEKSKKKKANVEGVKPDLEICRHIERRWRQNWDKVERAPPKKAPRLEMT